MKSNLADLQELLQISQREDTHELMEKTFCSMLEMVYTYFKPDADQEIHLLQVLSI